MAIWAIADLHLSFGTPGKEMAIFGPDWENHYQKIEKNWKERIAEDDLVLIAGDISWAMKIEEAVPDLEWIDKLPGTKVMIRGNHDYWWGSLSKVEKICPPSVHPIQHNIFRFGSVEIGGTRLWDTSEYRFDEFIEKKEVPKIKQKETQQLRDEAEKIFIRELGRLEMSLKMFSPQAEKRIVMTHYPPIGADLAPSYAAKLLEKHGVDICVFGHLHSVRPGSLLFGEARGIEYHLTSADYLKFIPKEVSNLLLT